MYGIHWKRVGGWLQELGPPGLCVSHVAVVRLWVCVGCGWGWAWGVANKTECASSSTAIQVFYVTLCSSLAGMPTPPGCVGPSPKEAGSCRPHCCSLMHNVRSQVVAWPFNQSWQACCAPWTWLACHPLDRPYLKSSIVFVLAPGNALTGSLPSGWQLPPKLQLLSLWANQFTGPIPENFTLPESLEVGLAM